MVGAFMFSGLLLAFSLSRDLAASTALLLGVGFAMVLTNALSNGILQTLAPDALRGRVMAAYTWVFVGVGPVIGPYFAGTLARQTGAIEAVAVFAVATLLYGAWAFWRHPEIRQL